METKICEICGNINYDETCIRCNWKDYNMWNGITFDEAVKSPDWKGFGWECPVCGNYNNGEFPEHDVCPVCGWEDDPVQNDDPDYHGGANSESLNQYRAEWEERKKTA